jgi:hypothetical protein
MLTDETTARGLTVTSTRVDLQRKQWYNAFTVSPPREAGQQIAQGGPTNAQGTLERLRD